MHTAHVFGAWFRTYNRTGAETRAQPKFIVSVWELHSGVLVALNNKFSNDIIDCLVILCIVVNVLLTLRHVSSFLQIWELQTTLFLQFLSVQHVSP